jgi:hypothetical protein
MAQLLTRAGLPNNRNLAKPYRAQRMVGDKIHPMDNMRLGAYGQAVNSTGCMGVVSNFGVRAKTFGPQKGKRRSVKRKNVALVCSTREILRSKYKAVEWLVSLRSQLLVVQTIGDFLGRDLLGKHLSSCLHKISVAIRSRVDPEQWAVIVEREEHSRQSLWGRLEKDGPGKIKLRKIRDKVQHAMKTL